MRNLGSDQTAFCDQILHQLSVNNRKNCCFCKAKWTRMRTKQFLKECPALLEHLAGLGRFQVGASPSRKNSKAKQQKKTCGVRVLKKMRFATHLNSECAARSLTSGKGAPQHFFQVPDGSMFFLNLFIFFEIFLNLILTFFLGLYIVLNINATSAGK